MKEKAAAGLQGEGELPKERKFIEAKPALTLNKIQY